MTPAQLCIARPIGTTLLALALSMAGTAAFLALPVAPLPKVDMPMIMVQASLPGASPETIASSVATPLERRFGRIAGLDELTSTSTLGSTQIALQFALSRDIDGAARDVQAAIAAAMGDLPAGMPSQPVVRKANPSDAPILILAVTSTSHSLGELFDLSSTVIAPTLAQVPGVGQVAVAGGQQPAVRVQADPTRLAHQNLTLDDLADTIAAANAAGPLGRLQGGTEARIVQANDQIFAAAAYRTLRLPGSQIMLGDVADVFDDVENSRVAAWIDGRRGIILFARREANANIIDTIVRMRARLPSVIESMPQGIDIEVALDRSATIAASVHDVERTLILTVLLVVAVVWLFLADLRATLIPAAAVPLSLLGTFAAMHLGGFSLNNLSLMALTISTGFVVDDAIVVTETIERLRAQGMGRVQAAIAGAQEISFTVLSMTASLLAVFLPLICMSGVVGRLFHEFAWTLGLSVAVSAGVSLTITPMMCAVMLRQHSASAEVSGRLERFFSRLAKAYGRGLKIAIAHPGGFAGGTAVAAALSVALFATSPKGLFPSQDTHMLMAMTQGPQDISFAAMRARQEAVGALFLADPGVEHVINTLGGGGPGGGGQATGSLFVGLNASSGQQNSSQAVMARLRPQLAALDGIETFMQPVQDLRMGGRGTRSEFTLAVQADNLAALADGAEHLRVAMAHLPELKDVTSDAQAAGLEVHVSQNRDVAARLGLTTQSIDAALGNALGQRQVATVYGPQNAYRVVLEACPSSRQSPSAIDALRARTARGGAVPLGTVTTQHVSPVALSVNHQGQFAATSLSFNLAPKVALNQAVAAISAAQSKLDLPEGVSTNLVGTAQAYAATSSQQPWLIVFALAVVFIVLGVLYESVWHPLTILSTLPSAGVGALCALRLCGTELSLIAFVGIILLIGIVKKNAIMMVDVALERQRHQGESAAQAIYAACMLRFRPIMMTTCAALLGALPLALGHGVGSELRRPLGIAIVGGLVVSQALTLFTTPAIFLLFERVRRKLQVASGRPAPFE